MMEGVNTILQSGNTHRVAKAKYEQAVTLQRAGNKVKKAQGDLASWSRSLANRNRVEAAERQYNDNMAQLAHNLKQNGKEGSNLTLQHAEAVGTVRAQAAMSGVGGNTVEAMENLIALQTATSEEELKEAIESMSYYGKENSTQLVADAMNSQDFSQTVAEFDYTQHIAPKPLKYKWLKLVGVAAATYFGGPQAGEAAADAFVGQWQAQNGDFGGASASYGQALQGGMTAFKQWSDRGGTAWGSDAFSGFRASGGGRDSGQSFVKVSSQSNSKGGGGMKSFFSK